MKKKDSMNKGKKRKRVRCRTKRQTGGKSQEIKLEEGLRREEEHSEGERYSAFFTVTGGQGGAQTEPNKER